MELTNDARTRLLMLPTGNIADCNIGGGVMDAAIKPIDRTWKMVGRAMPVQGAPGDNLALHRAISQAKQGDVLVFDLAGFCGGGHFGDMMAHACAARGVAGVVIDGSCRDTEDLRELGLPVFARGANPAPTRKAALGEVGVTVTVGGVTVRRGDIVFGDADGVVVIPREHEDEVFARAYAKHEHEEHIASELMRGVSLLEVYGFDKLVARLQEQ